MPDTSLSGDDLNSLTDTNPWGASHPWNYGKNGHHRVVGSSDELEGSWDPEKRPRNISLQDTLDAIRYHLPRAIHAANPTYKAVWIGEIRLLILDLAERYMTDTSLLTTLINELTHQREELEFYQRKDKSGPIPPPAAVPDPKLATGAELVAVAAEPAAARIPESEKEADDGNALACTPTDH
jgi:hypothetical protein